ncbi:hypothetical protein ETB97_004636 [Aspergillus alliaceus]|uniref:Uncharacterized protein n=1 Tax=Petromyces alliaceus TaxID=209559 RepID=A0A8H6A1B6_PETAA|nr:hypothetical protein ETB97_004636 [Aspergillus burnettii]
MSPWVLRPYTTVDVEKAVSALQRLITAIESRQPAHSSPSVNPSTLGLAQIPLGTFIHDFLKAISTIHIPFRYIAPGIDSLAPQNSSNNHTSPPHLDTMTIRTIDQRQYSAQTAKME